MDISIVVPVFNEQDNAEAVYSAIRSALQAMGCSYEIVMVDDGSSDGSYGVLARLASEDPALKVIRFRRNFGQAGDKGIGQH